MEGSPSNAIASRYPSSSTAGGLTTELGDTAFLTYDELDEKAALRSVADDGAGATVLFSGTTRDSFRGKQVIKLEYEAYTSLALKTLQSLLERAHTSAPFADNPLPLSANADPNTDSSEDGVTRCYIAHRLGEVKVGECSILIAVSSPHRKEAFVVAEWLLEEVKKSVAVWKREFYASGDSIVAQDGQGELSHATQTSIEGDSRAEEAKEGAEPSWSWKANFPST
ncbi:Molybdopterin biosynthesis MoaE [Kalmanozyma brasiliensis GHG001]|uniref:Molybdopterin biosynthesis MoaE n=1 Tax=Kalmanozyma brasiliensis (strain GHG001) TaxID=1365824 RepID=UPI002867D19D|nr:Molybdopterin biosynthesis MoaE [Kalmanozyma brasiliensis GHG001]KAF6767139.1 Molybdopterin biosynthesis MoaE [Kalmanozyma brasiliensis GHG001]